MTESKGFQFDTTPKPVWWCVTTDKKSRRRATAHESVKLARAAADKAVASGKYVRVTVMDMESANWLFVWEVESFLKKPRNNSRRRPAADDQQPLDET